MTSILAMITAAVLAAAPIEAPKAPESPADYIMLAAMAGDSGDLTKAETILRDGLKAFPSASGMHLILGRILEKKGEAAEAFYEYQWEVALSGADSQPGDVASERTAIVLRNVSRDRVEIVAVMRALQLTQSDPAAARAALEKIEAKRGRRTVLDLFRAEAASMAGDDAGAAAAFRATIDDAPTLVAAYVELSAVLAKMGKANEAKSVFEKGREIDPDNWRLVAH